MKTVHNTFETLNSKVGVKYGTTLPTTKENVQHTHCGTGITFTLETLTEEQVEKIIAKGSDAFVKIQPQKHQPPTPEKTPVPKLTADKKIEEDN